LGQPIRNSVGCVILSEFHHIDDGHFFGEVTAGAQKSDEKHPYGS